MDSVVKTYDDNTPEEKAKIAEEERKWQLAKILWPIQSLNRNG
jgi:hypothetical protein